MNVVSKFKIKREKSQQEERAMGKECGVVAVGQSREDQAMLFRGWFLKALQDEEVRRIIRQLTAEAVVSVKVQVPDGKVVELERQLASKERSLEKARTEQREAGRQIDAAIAEKDAVQAELKLTKAELKRFQVLSAMNGAYEQYQKLPASTRKSLNDVINGKDLLSFVCSGVQESNLERFWDICNEAFIEGDVAAESLAMIFGAFFDLSQGLGTLNAIERLSVAVGDRFDNDLCTRIARSAPTGCVREVLLQGYRYRISKKIMKKSLVRV